MLNDDAFRAVGGFGRYQCFLSVCVGVSVASVATSIYAFVFIISTGNYWCKDPRMDGFNMAVQAVQNSSSHALYDDSIMQNSKCSMYMGLDNNTGVSDVPGPWASNGSLLEVECQYGWVYEDADIETTITMEWDLVCDREYLAGITQTVQMAGMAVGGVTSGIFADRFGRFKTLAISQIILTASAIIAPFSTGVMMFSVLRFLNGVSNYASTTTAFVLCVENITSDKRATLALCRCLFWTFSMLLTVGAAYIFQHWRTFMLVLASIPMLGTLLLCFISESPRWLYTKGRYSEADAVMAKIAKWNGHPTIRLTRETMKKQDNNTYGGTGMSKFICKYPKLFYRIIILAFLWLAVVLAFYGLTYNSISLGNKYLNFAISAAIELPSYMIVWVGLDRIGRRLMTGVPLLVGGGVLLLIMAVPSDSEMTWLLITMSNIGKMGICLAFTSLTPYTTELSPTVIRNTVAGFVGSCGRIGTFIAPQLAFVAMQNKYIPLATFGILAFMAGASTFILPETTGLNLPETLEDGEQLGKKKECRPDMANETNEEHIPALDSNAESEC